MKSPKKKEKKQVLKRRESAWAIVTEDDRVWEHHNKRSKIEEGWIYCTFKDRHDAEKYFKKHFIQNDLTRIVKCFIIF